MTLSFVAPEERELHINVLIYGPPKSGKSSGAATAPGPVLYLNLDLPNALAHALRRAPDLREVRFEGLRTLVDVQAAIEQQSALPASDRMFRTIVVDPLGELHRRLLDEASSSAVRPTLQQYGDVATHVERFCRGLCELPINVVLVAHEYPVRDESTGGMERLPWTGTTNPALGQKLMGLVDVVGYCGVAQTEDGTRYLAQLISASGRRGGDRFAVLGEVRDLDLGEWYARIAEAPGDEQLRLGASASAASENEKEVVSA